MSSLNQDDTFAVPPFVPRHERDLGGDQPQAALAADVIAAAKAALDDGQTHYVDVAGIAPLREALAGHLQTAYGSSYEQGNVVVTAGIQEARFLSLQMIGESHISIALPAVVHPGVKTALQVRPLVTHTIPTSPERGHLPTLADIEAALEAGHKLLYLESPCRLTGKAFDGKEVAAISDLVDTYEAEVIWDQGLAPWVDGQPYASLAAEPGMTGRVAVIGEAWSGSGIDAWFLGYAAAPADRVAAMVKQKQIMSICTSTASQYAGLAAAELYASQHDEQRERLANTQKAVQGILSAAGISIAAGNTASLLALQLSADQKAAAVGRLQAAGFDCTDGREFGDEHLVRLAMTFDETALNAARHIIAGQNS